MFLLLKALHVFGFVAWFAGLFYLGRLFVYHREAMERAEPAKSILIKEFGAMQWRVYNIICNPGMMITWTCGLGMIYIYGWEWFSVNYWLHFKLVLLLGLVAYHLYAKRIILQLEDKNTLFTSYQFRLLNEVPTLFLLSIALLAVYKNTLNFLYAFLGILFFGFLLVMATKAYKKWRLKNEGGRIKSEE